LRLHDAENEEYFNWATKNGGAMEALIEMKNKGEIAEISLGMNNPDYILKFLRLYPLGTFDNILMAGSWNLLDFSGIEVLLECQNRGIKITLAGIFGSGMLWGKNILKYKPADKESLQKREKWQNLCDRFNCSLPAVALNFSFLPSCVTSVCIGALFEDNVDKNMLLLKESVPKEIWREAQNQDLLPHSLCLDFQS